MTMPRSSTLAIIVCAISWITAVQANAAIFSTRAQLDALLGSSEVTENFDRIMPQDPSGLCDSQVGWR